MTRSRRPSHADHAWNELLADCESEVDRLTCRLVFIREHCCEECAEVFRDSAAVRCDRCLREAGPSPFSDVAGHDAEVRAERAADREAWSERG